MTVHKVANLIGKQLDRAVGIAMGYEIDEWGENRSIRESSGAPTEWSPSTDWRQAGPIIERMKIDIEHASNRGEEGFDEGGDWCAYAPTKDGVNRYEAETPLVAAMRAYVASRFGDDVDIPV